MSSANIGLPLGGCPPTLSICIPTYNFGKFIGATLESIVPQLRAEVEVVVVDGASTDDTEEVVGRFQRRFPQIRYERLPAKGGIDLDMARAVDLSNGEYCWLFSADDIMEPQAVDRVLAAIARKRDLYLGRHSGGTLDLSLIYHTYPVLRSEGSAVFDLSNRQERSRYFALAETSEAFFSFMGTLIVRREKWLSMPLDERFVGSCWAHAARLLSMMKGGLTVEYLPQVILMRRGDNDSFASAGLVQRYSLAIDGYHRIAAELFGPHSFEATHIRRVIRKEFMLRPFLFAKMQCVHAPHVEDIRELDRLARLVFLDGTALNNLRYGIFRIMPANLYSMCRKFYRSAKRPFRNERRSVPS